MYMWINVNYLQDNSGTDGCTGHISERLAVSDFFDMGGGKFEYDVGTCNLNGASIHCKN